MSIRDALQRVVAGHDLSAAEMSAAMDEVLSGDATPVQVAAFAVALRIKGETVTEIAAAARSLRGAATQIDLEVEGPLLDTCGTGGDGAGSFNISTVSAIVVAASGVKVAKHGNRAVSSRCGSADVLEALGVELGGDEASLRRSIREAGIAFLFAPAHHAALRHAASARRELGMRTFFNLLGPLANPAGATHQLVGVFERSRVRSTAAVLGSLGLAGAWVVHGEGGLDEIAPTGVTWAASWDGSTVREFELTPSDFGVAEAALSTLGGGDAAENAALARRVLQGEVGGPRNAVLLNAGAALVVAGAATSPAEGATMAAQAIDDGRALATLTRWIQASA